MNSKINNRSNNKKTYIKKTKIKTITLIDQSCKCFFMFQNNVLENNKISK